MQYIMHLTSIPFEQIKKGDKKIETRLFDEKRQHLTIGDIIIFYKRPENKENLKVKIIELTKFKTFTDAYKNYDLRKYEKKHISIKSAVDSMYKYYSKEDEKLFGVIVIEFEMIS